MSNLLRERTVFSPSGHPVPIISTEEHLPALHSVEITQEGIRVNPQSNTSSTGSIVYQNIVSPSLPETVTIDQIESLRQTYTDPADPETQPIIHSLRENSAHRTIHSPLRPGHPFKEQNTNHLPRSEALAFEFDAALLVIESLRDFSATKIESLLEQLEESDERERSRPETLITRLSWKMPSVTTIGVDTWCREMQIELQARKQRVCHLAAAEAYSTVTDSKFSEFAFNRVTIQGNRGEVTITLTHLFQVTDPITGYSWLLWGGRIKDSTHPNWTEGRSTAVDSRAIDQVIPVSPDSQILTTNATPDSPWRTFASCVAAQSTNQIQHLVGVKEDLTPHVGSDAKFVRAAVMGTLESLESAGSPLSRKLSKQTPVPDENEASAIGVVTQFNVTTFNGKTGSLVRTFEKTGTEEVAYALARIATDSPETLSQYGSTLFNEIGKHPPHVDSALASALASTIQSQGPETLSNHDTADAFQKLGEGILGIEPVIRSLISSALDAHSKYVMPVFKVCHNYSPPAQEVALRLARVLAHTHPSEAAKHIDSLAPVIENPTQNVRRLAVALITDIIARHPQALNATLLSKLVRVQANTPSSDPVYARSLLTSAIHAPHLFSTIKPDPHLAQLIKTLETQGRDCYPATVSDAPDPYLSIGLRCNDHRVREMAVLAAAGLPEIPDKSLPAVDIGVLARLATDNPLIAKFALRAAAKIADRSPEAVVTAEAVDALRECTKEYTGRTRAYALRGIGAAASDAPDFAADYVDCVFEALRSPSPHTRREGLKALIHLIPKCPSVTASKIDRIKDLFSDSETSDVLVGHALLVLASVKPEVVANMVTDSQLAILESVAEESVWLPNGTDAATVLDVLNA